MWFRTPSSFTAPVWTEEPGTPTAPGVSPASYAQQGRSPERPRPRGRSLALRVLAPRLASGSPRGCVRVFEVPGSRGPEPVSPAASPTSGVAGPARVRIGSRVLGGSGLATPSWKCRAFPALSSSPVNRMKTQLLNILEAYLMETRTPGRIFLSFRLFTTF